MSAFVKSVLFLLLTIPVAGLACDNLPPCPWGPGYKYVTSGDCGSYDEVRADCKQYMDKVEAKGIERDSGGATNLVSFCDIQNCSDGYHCDSKEKKCVSDCGGSSCNQGLENDKPQLAMPKLPMMSFQ